MPAFGLKCCVSVVPNGSIFTLDGCGTPIQGTLTVLGLSAAAQAKKGQGKTQKSRTTRRRDLAGLDQLKKEQVTESGTVQDVPNLTRLSSGSALQSLGEVTDRKDVTAEERRPVSADRGTVLKACVGTSAAISLAGILVRQGSHWAAEGGLQVPDCTLLMPYASEIWHVVPTVGVVVLVTSLRQILLQVWPAFRQSNEAANTQVLGSLEQVDILTVSCLSGISEELLFRGALLPLLGPDWRGILGAGIIFGALHLTGGRNTAFAVWASVVGILYGALGQSMGDLATPMAAHSASNVLGAAFWKMRQGKQRI